MMKMKHIALSIAIAVSIAGCQSSAPPYISVFNINELFRDKRFELVYATDFSEAGIKNFVNWPEGSVEIRDGHAFLGLDDSISWSNLSRQDSFYRGRLIALRYRATPRSLTTFELYRPMGGERSRPCPLEWEVYTIARNGEDAFIHRCELNSESFYRLMWTSEGFFIEDGKEYLAAFYLNNDLYLNAYLINYLGEGERFYFRTQTPITEGNWDVFIGCGEGSVTLLEYMEYRELL